MIKLLENLDRRWIFLAMALCVSVPILVIGLTGITFPETPTPLAEAFFAEVDRAGEANGRRANVLIALDYDPASAGELSPMSASLVNQCSKRGHRMYFISLWPVGPQMIDDSIEKVIKRYYPNLVYGEDYVNLGFKAGNEQVIKVMGIDAWGWDAPLAVQAENARASNRSDVFRAAHYVGVEKEYCHMERLANLDQLPSTGVTVCAFPLKVKGGSADPTRAVAMIDEVSS